MRSAAIIDILVAEGYSVAFQAMVQRDPAPEARLRAVGATVLAVVPAKQWAWSQQGGCPYDLIYVARRNVFQLALNAIKSGCPGVPIVYDTGRWLSLLTAGYHPGNAPVHHAAAASYSGPSLPARG